VFCRGGLRPNRTAGALQTNLLRLHWVTRSKFVVTTVQSKQRREQFDRPRNLIGRREIALQVALEQVGVNLATSSVITNLYSPASDRVSNALRSSSPASPYPTDLPPAGQPRAGDMSAPTNGNDEPSAPGTFQFVELPQEQDGAQP